MGGFVFFKWQGFYIVVFSFILFCCILKDLKFSEQQQKKSFFKHKKNLHISIPAWLSVAFSFGLKVRGAWTSIYWECLKEFSSLLKRHKNYLHYVINKISCISNSIWVLSLSKAGRTEREAGSTSQGPATKSRVPIPYQTLCSDPHYSPSPQTVPS